MIVARTALGTIPFRFCLKTHDAQKGNLFNSVSVWDYGGVPFWNRCYLQFWNAATRITMDAWK